MTTSGIGRQQCRDWSCASVWLSNTEMQLVPHTPASSSTERGDGPAVGTAPKRRKWMCSLPERGEVLERQWKHSEAQSLADGIFVQGQAASARRQVETRHLPPGCALLARCPPRRRRPLSPLSSIPGPTQRTRCLRPRAPDFPPPQPTT